MKKIPKAATLLAATLAALGCLSSARAADSIVYSPLYSFDGTIGGQPDGGLFLSTDGKFYGMSTTGSVVFSYTLGAPAPVALHTLTTTEGSAPSSTFIEPVAGTLVASATNGGVNLLGTIFSINKSTGAVTVLHSPLAGEPNGYLGKPLYGSDAFVYATAPVGGSSSKGGIVRVGLDGLNYLVLHDSTAADGAPADGVIEATDGFLYGVTTDGGTNSLGSIFVMAKDGSSYSTVHSLATADGTAPQGGLLQASDGFLYGMTSAGGANGFGTIFRMSTAGTGFQVIHDFDGTSGASPQGRLIQAQNGMLYATTNVGGDANLGVIFRIATDGSAFQVLASLTASGGSNPLYGALVESPAGSFYGMTRMGGTTNNGVIFRLTATPITRPTLPPTVKVNGPKSRTTTLSKITLRGRVTDPNGLSTRVDVKVGKRPYRKAKGVTQWNYVASLSGGRNNIRVRATNALGQQSLVQRIVVNRVLLP